MRLGLLCVIATGFGLAAAGGAVPARAVDPPIGARDAAEIVAQISDLLQQNYPFPDISAAYAAALAKNEKVGRYNGLDACVLADRLRRTCGPCIRIFISR